ncbi:D(2) dopamine receptor-like [Strongylocentrotus purpuratus]|uniref:G-protein coupled receptors family 1 profile domain-containing protein n=1 Tax=Strongylocentrotus purpuratus TaxID=7668 RepID=W4XXT1_STRPU|nr:D(2) dopamine receptor-like [Strongylocentrotus purpuratus]|eukprot:XP_011678991.1 PREDICTED: D(2) dopamine receptor-like [Strongylocentrotus purpuratus]
MSPDDYFVYDEGTGQDKITVCNMTFNIEPGEYILHDYAPRVILALLVLVIFLIGILGNLFVVAAVILSKRLQNTTNVFVINLAVADFLTAMFLPVHASTLLNKSSCYIPELLCQFVAAATLTTLGCSVVTLAAIAFHRFTVLNAILKPQPKFNNAFSTRNIVIMVSFTWLYPIILMFIILPLDVGSLGYALQYKVCAQNTENENSDYLTLTVCLLIQFPAFIVIIVCYFNIFKMFRCHQQEMNAIMAPSVMISTTDSEVVNITIIEDLSKEQPDAPNDGTINLGFNESDGIKIAPPEDREILTEPSDAAELHEIEPMTNGDSEVNITIIEDLSKEQPDAPNDGTINPGFDESDGIKTSPPEDREILTEPSDAEELHEIEPMKNGKHSKAPQALNPDRTGSTTISPSGPTTQPTVQIITRDTLARESQEVRYKQQRKITINLFIIVCVYTICVMPPAVSYLIPTSDPAVPWFTILFLCNVCVNPILYALRHPTFHEVLMCMLKCSYRDIPDKSSFLKALIYSINDARD